MSEVQRVSIPDVPDFQFCLEILQATINQVRDASELQDLELGDLLKLINVQGKNIGRLTQIYKLCQEENPPKDSEERWNETVKSVLDELRGSKWNPRHPDYEQPKP